MAIWDFITKRLGNWGREQGRGGGALILDRWSTPSERNAKGFLEAYGQVYSLFGIVQRIASSVSEVRWRLYKGSERGERNQIASHAILDLLDYANQFQTGQEIIELHSIHSDCAGRVFWYVPRNKLGLPGEIWLLPPHQVKIIASKKEFIAGFVFESGSEQIPLSTDEVIWFSMPDPVNPLSSIGFAQAASVEIDSESYSGKWNRNFFYNSARADAILETENTLSDEEFETLKKQWNAEHRGLGAAHKVAILQGGLKYKQTQIMPKEMDFSQLRKQTRENLMFTFGMPLSVMGVSENVNKANAEAGDYVFARYLIKPRLIKIRNKLNEQLLPMFNAKGLELDFDEVVPETIEQKRMLAESGIRSGSMTINESRKLYGLEPLPPESGNVLLIPLNLIATPVKSIGKSVKKGFDEQRKEALWNIYVNKAGSYEKKLINELKNMFDNQQKEALGNLNENTGPKTKLVDLTRAKEDFVKAVKPALSELLKESLSDAEELISPETRKANPALIAALAWLSTRIGWAADEVGNETASLLARQLIEGYAAGEDIQQIARRIESVFEHCDKTRALTIARTETIMAANEGALHGYEEAGVEKMEFYAALDERACEDCLGLHSEIFDKGNAHGVIPLHPNCRCRWLPVI